MKDFTDFGIDTRGHSSGQVKTLCPQCSPSRKKSKYPCLSVNINDGIWLCWHCDWRGTLKQGEEQRSQRPQKTYRKPRHPTPLLKDDLQQWLERRAIPFDVAQSRRLTLTRIYFQQAEEEMDAIAFPYYRDGELINVKYRALKEKYFRMAPGAERILYGIDSIAGDTLIWVEGEVDALSIEAAGFASVVSVPDGAPAPDTKQYETKFDFLESAGALLQNVSKHILAVDNDAPGQALSRELARRLGPEKCYTVTWTSDCKDANDVLMSYGVDDLRECVDRAEPWPIEGIIRPLSLWASLETLYQKGHARGISTGWKTVDPYYTVRAGEWTMIQGIPSHGKSSYLSAMAMQLAKQSGWRFAICSPEHQPLEDYLAQLCQLHAGAPFYDGPQRRMSWEEALQSCAWIDERMSFLLPSDHTPSLDELLDMARVEVLRRGIQGLIIDPYNELDHSRPYGMTETEYISQFISKIRLFARRQRVHVWLVVHPTKMFPKEDGSYPVPKPYDSSGSAHWYNKGDNILTIYRDVKADNNRVQLHVQKIRFRQTGKPGVVELYYHQATGRFSE